MTSAIELLRHVDLFQHLTEQQLEDLAAQTRELTFRKHAIMMTEGDAGESMYVIKSGSVKVYVSDDEGRELVLYQQGPGAAIGDISLLDDEPRSASVSTLEPSTALMIGKQAFLECLRASPEMAINIIRSLTQRLRDATEGSRSLALDNVYRRLADKLQELCVSSDEPDNDEAVTPRKYSHQELGNMIGASREMVGKVMAELVKGEYLEVRDGRIHLLRKLPRNW
ncbi:Crp/Fnr family transcriptional regulator [Granulosicoccus antarcticus]|uniref:Cyclic AMP receptor-like protein n=1 Tax=Granulosicoccus antarcticus IMCC3135 TaxID=1192854 RepID=A0A2Z2NK81_9GAMM|nr:Crp/Fnr family transcriptional regulator [Granulosicoccus antarcticus]ASJ70288.1 Cyclic AMP receptor-like protein [Granulosicoccus antarcticus IMCC3135]